MNDRSLDIGRALTYMFEEEDWVTKFLIAVAMVLLSFLIIPGLILQGYVIEIIRRVSRQQAPALPAWTEWGNYLAQGFMAAVALLVYSLPTVLLSCCLALFAAAATDETGEASGGILLLICCVVILILLVQIPLYLLYYLGLIRYAETREFTSFFQFGRLWNYARAHLGTYGYGVIIIFLANVVGGFLPVVGQAWANLVTGHVLGQVARIATGPDLDSTVAVGPTDADL